MNINTLFLTLLRSLLGNFNKCVCLIMFNQTWFNWEFVALLQFNFSAKKIAIYIMSTLHCAVAKLKMISFLTYCIYIFHANSTCILSRYCCLNVSEIFFWQFQIGISICIICIRWNLSTQQFTLWEWPFMYSNFQISASVNCFAAGKFALWRLGYAALFLAFQ